MPTVPYREGGDYPELPVRTPVLVKVIESKYRTEKNPFYGKEDKDGKIDERETRDVVKVVMECEDAEYTGTRVWANFTASIAEKSKFRPFVQACHSHELTLDELKAFNTDTLVGMRVYVSGEYADTDPEHKFLRPTGFMRVATEAAPTRRRKPAAAAAAAETPVAAAAPAAAAPAAAAKPSARATAVAALKAKQDAEMAALNSATDEPGDDDGEFDPDETPF